VSDPALTTSRTAPLVDPFVGPFDGPFDAGELLADLRAERLGAPPLPALDSETYARGHAAFEARSDQRRLIAEHLAACLAGRGGGDVQAPVSVLSVGCGDGTLDRVLAAGLLDDAGPGRPVRYVGVDPHRSGTEAFAAALGGLDSPDLVVDTSATTWAGTEVVGPFDVVTFVHSMYYVPDVADAVRQACALLRPGGDLLVLSGPRGAMNALVDVCAPPVEGHRQWFSDDVAAGIAAASGPTYDVAPVETLEALLSLESPTADVLDFTVQARLTPSARALVLTYLDAVSVPHPVAGDPRVPHPVDVHRVTRLR
jgi:SAM-dependent methyltransferase